METINYYRNVLYLLVVIQNIIYLSNDFINNELKDLNYEIFGINLHEYVWKFQKHNVLGLIMLYLSTLFLFFFVINNVPVFF